MSSWLVLPTYNEAPNVAQLVTAARRLQPDLHVLVVDDASPDGTAAIVQRLAESDPVVRLLDRRGRRGYGRALADGFRHVLAEDAQIIVTMDCDFSHDPADLSKLRAALENASLAIGSRYTPGGAIRDWPLFRRLLSAAANAFVRILFRLPARDCTSGFRAYRRRALEGVPWDRLHSTGYSFLVEALYWVSRDASSVVAEVPICYTERTQGTSKMGWREIVSGATNLLKLRFELLGRRSSPVA